jgi:hypothetical protein
LARPSFLFSPHIPPQPSTQQYSTSLFHFSQLVCKQFILLKQVLLTEIDLHLLSTLKFTFFKLDNKEFLYNFLKYSRVLYLINLIVSFFHKDYLVLSTVLGKVLCLYHHCKSEHSVFLKIYL